VAIAAPTKPSAGVSKILSVILKIVATVKENNENFWCPVIINRVPTDPHKIFISWPLAKIINASSPPKKLTPKKESIYFRKKQLIRTGENHI
jgi:hypothetical protein